MQVLFRFAWAFVLLLTILFGFSCDNQPTFEEQLDIDRKIIEEYVATNNITGSFLDEGIFISFIQEGTGTETPALSDSIVINYTGLLLDGTVFDSNDSARFRLGGLIPGWQIGLQEFKLESDGILIIPSGLAYGPTGIGPIPGNAVLRFNIEMIDFF